MAKKRWKIGVRLILLMLIVPIVALTYFLFANEAPILEGKIIYGEAYRPNQELDIYMPTERKHEQIPVVVFVHGGAWIGGFKESVNSNRFNEVFNRLRANGYAIVSPNYTLARNGKTPFPDCIRDVYEAMYWVEQKADSFDFDLNNVGIFGESAGAHISMMVAFDSAQKYTDKVFTYPLRYVVDIYGPNELQGIYHQHTVDSMNALIEELPEPIKSSVNITEHLFGFDPKTDSARATKYLVENSPRVYAHQEVPPTLIIQGDEDLIVPLSQSVELSQKLDSLEVVNHLHIIPEANHGFIGASKDQKAQIHNWIYEFVVEYYQ
ncbi:alpha/beta hydrolase [bacterium SCSIO 12643]|nr:alpha/beta hydrolase [bacterium SCSIO 12643]